MLGSFEKVLLFFCLVGSMVWFSVVDDWYWVWLLFELNMFSFLPILSYGRWYRRSMSSMRYFLVQAWGSIMILVGIILYSCSNFLHSCVDSSYGNGYGLFFFVSFMFWGVVLKLGLWPVHFWFMKVVDGVSYFSGFLVCTSQKVLPLMILVYLSFVYHLFFYLIFLGVGSGFVGSFGGLVQTRVRRFLAYSSLGSIGWILIAISYSLNFGVLFFVSYIFSCFCVFMSSFYLNLSSFLGFYRLVGKSGFLGLSFLLGVFSLAGFPPLLGFFSKISVLILVGSYGSLFQVLVLSVLGVISMFFYVWFSYGCFMMVFPFSVSSSGGWFSYYKFGSLFLSLGVGAICWGGLLFFPFLLYSF
nr:NADH dehydrogenase subunit 2 [Rhabdopleura sp. NHMO H2136]